MKGKSWLLIGTYGAGLFFSNAASFEALNEWGDPMAAMSKAASGVTGTASYIDLTPHTVVDEQIFDLNVHMNTFRDIKIQKDS
ncbi:MAG: hypothetical protein IT288_05670 [Bdellovibrionales bacterium]|nr:hypothetical protein [Bdellovibrionales bacterium]